MPICEKCNIKFPSSALIEGKRRSLTGRTNCLDCNPFGKRPLTYKGKYRATDDEVIIAVSQSKSYAETLRRLNLVIFGSAYETLKNRLKDLNIDTSHFTGKGHSKGGNFYKIPLDEILVKDSTYRSTSTLKKRLIKERVFEDKCSNCGLEEWLGNYISLHLDHINGNRKDNRKENLRLLCPNCHSQTSTYCRKKQI